MGAAFVLGLLMDVADGSVMGQHALAYVLLAFAAGGLSRRILWFPLSQQALHVLPLLLGDAAGDAGRAHGRRRRVSRRALFPRSFIARRCSGIRYLSAAAAAVPAGRDDGSTNRARSERDARCVAAMEFKNPQEELERFQRPPGGRRRLRAVLPSPCCSRASSGCRSSSTTTTRRAPRTTASRWCRSCPTAA